MGLKKRELKEFRNLLNEEKSRLLQVAEDAIAHEIELSKDDMADEADLASALTDQSLSLRLRGREQILLKKIDFALERIEDGSYGECTECEDDINPERLRARPVTTLCIACKEEQEQRERHFL